MIVACLQMDAQFACVEENFLHAEKLIGDAMKDAPDVIVLPETFTTGFFISHCSKRYGNYIRIIFLM